MRTASFTTIWVSAQRVGRLTPVLAYVFWKFHIGCMNSRPRDEVEQLLCVLAHAFALLCILFLHLADGLLLPRL
jgi:hypothetical protein